MAVNVRSSPLSILLSSWSRKSLFFCRHSLCLGEDLDVWKKKISALNKGHYTQIFDVGLLGKKERWDAVKMIFLIDVQVELKLIFFLHISP